MPFYLRVEYGNVPEPNVEEPQGPIILTDATMEERKQKVLKKMKMHHLDFLLIYADREHGANFGYLTGFEPRFEEAMLILFDNGRACFILGNENLKMQKRSRLHADVVHMPHLSLPNQPMKTSLKCGLFTRQAGIKKGMKGGIVGWKLFTSKLDDNNKLFDIPHFLYQDIVDAVGDESCLINATGLFQDPEDGVRARVNANEIAYYEYGAALAANRIFNAMNALKPGIKETKLAERLNPLGQQMTVQTICASGERFTYAQVAPRDKEMSLGEPISLTMGLRGGLTCRSGFIAEDAQSIPAEQSDYLQEVAIPYFCAMTEWYKNVRPGITGGEIYDLMEKIVPKDQFGWILNPGHLISSEEWLSSPFWPKSDVLLKSGMMLQMDLILSVVGLNGCNAEDGIALADEKLRKEVSEEYPEVWSRISNRQKYMREILGITIHDEVLPLSGLCGYVRPFFLCRKKALYISQK